MRVSQKQGNSESHTFIVYSLPFICVLCYLNGLDGDFVHDDIFAIVNNPDVTSKNDVWRVFVNDFWGTPMDDTKSHKSYRPLAVLWFRFDYYISGGNPKWFHLVNTLLHGCVTCALTHVCLHVLHTSWMCALFASLLFAVHPVHTEAVTGIVGRADVLAGLFFLLSLSAYSRSIEEDKEDALTPSRDANQNQVTHGKKKFTLLSHRQTQMLLVSLLLATAATLCKEIGVTVLGVCLLYDLLYHKTDVITWVSQKELPRSLMPVLTRALALTCTFTAIIVFRIRLMDFQLPVFKEEDNPASFSPHFLTRVLTLNYLLPMNVWLLLCPRVLSYDWQVGSIPLVESFSDYRNLATATFYVIAIAIGLRCWRYAVNEQSRRGTTTVMTVILLCVPFLPASNLFFRVGFVIAERVLYIPSMGMCVLIAHGLSCCGEKVPRFRGQMWTLFVLLILAMATKTWNRNHVWMSRDSLFWSGVQTLPHNAKAHYNLANYLKDSGDMAGAATHYRTAIRLYPNHASYHNNLGTTLTNQTEAEFHFREALRIVPNHKGAMINLGNLHLEQGKQDSATDCFRQALDIDPSYVDALLSMGKAMIFSEHYTEAERYIRQALELSPDNAETHNYYGALFQQTGHPENAVNEFQHAVMLNSRNTQAMKNAALSLRSLGRYEEAERWLKQALEQQHDSDSYQQLGQLYTDMGQKLNAMFAYKQALSRAPNDTAVHLNYIQALLDGKQEAEAEQAIAQLLQRDPHNIAGLLYAQRLAQKKGQQDEVMYYLKEATEQARRKNHTSLPQLYYELANEYRMAGNLEKSLEVFKKLVQIKESHVPSYINIGSIYFIQKKYKQAEEQYLKAISLDPENMLAIENLQKLRNVWINPSKEKT